MGLFTDDPQPSFSDLWYRVGPTRPRLSPHAQIIRQQFGERSVYIVEDPAAGNYYRLTESAYFFVGLLDGRRSVNDAWDAANAQLGDGAPTQRECVDLLAKLQRFGLLLGEQPLASDMLVLRQQETARNVRQKRRGRLFTVTVPLVNPEPVLERIAPVLRAIFSKWGAAAWVAMVGVALWTVVPRWGELSSSFNGILDPANLPWLAFMFLLLRGWHELGHAAACKAMGGRCTLIGLLLILLVIPLPFCDATSAWRFPEIWRRVVVSAAGMLFEVFVAAIAAVLWAYAEPGLLKALCYNAMVVSGVATIVFNANPLLRYDGYYILSDLTGTPNLAQHSRELWRYLGEKFGFGLKNLPVPSVRSTGDAWFLGVYAALSWPYRMFITFSLLIVVSQRYLSLGLVLAVIASAAWLVWPALKSAAYLASEPRLMGRRGRAIGVSLGALAALAVLVGVVPFPASGSGTGTVESVDHAILRPEEDGFVERVLVHAGENVEPGQAIVQLSNIDLEAEVRTAQAKLDQALAGLDDAAIKSPTDREIAQRAVEKARAEQARALARQEAMTVRSPVRGVLCVAGGAAGEFEHLVGQFVTRGTSMARVESPDRVVVKALVSDLDHAYVFKGREPSDVRPVVRVRGDAGERIEGRVKRVGPAGSRKLTSGALSTTAGGDIPLDPTDPRRERTVVPQFVVEVEPNEPSVTLRPGQRAWVRLRIDPEPLAWQAWRRIQQYFTTRRDT